MRLADLEVTAAFDLEPQPTDVVAHLRQNYAAARLLLEGFTDVPATRVAKISADDGYIYVFRPRTSFRRVLDHALDHTLQIDHWLEWRRTGVRPAPADGWASATVTLEEDTTEIGPADLSAWLWRIDTAMTCLSNRAAALTADDLAWRPPDGGWTLWQALHHVARDRFYAAWLADPLPTEPRARYRVASERLARRLADPANQAVPEGFMLFDRALNVLTREELLSHAIAAQRDVLAGKALETYADVTS
jgi:hypothetical protein